MFTTALREGFSVRRYVSSRSEVKRAWRNHKEAAKVSKNASLKAV